MHIIFQPSTNALLLIFQSQTVLDTYVYTAQTNGGLKQLQSVDWKYDASPVAQGLRGVSQF